MKDRFSILHLQAGYITPEAFPSFLDACQYRVGHDVCDFRTCLGLELLHFTGLHQF